MLNFHLLFNPILNSFGTHLSNMSPEDLIIEGHRKEIQKTFKKEKKLLLLEEMSIELDRMIEESQSDQETKNILDFMHVMIKKIYRDI